MTDLVPSAGLISLSDKTASTSWPRPARHGVEIVSTGGTRAKLRELASGARHCDLTGFPR
jgi:phosphoribosylaminoimidazolecarboxamide formyltransferase/IMP cyclohydrolase